MSSPPVTPRPKDPGPKAGSTPMKNHKVVPSERNAISDELESQFAAFHAIISGRVVGPVDVHLFNDFLPAVQGTGSEPDGIAAYKALEPALGRVTKEADMYEDLVKYFNTLRPSENINFCDKHSDVLKVFDGVDIKPDIVVYRGNENATIEAMFEVKYNDDDDPFDDLVDGFERESIRGKETLGQITSYATCHQATEFRTHAFSALIFRTYLRLLRWDRSGVVVTKKVLFNDSHLFDFFCRFTSATTVERGRDPTVADATLSPSQKTDIQHSLGCDEKANLLDISVGDKNYIIPKDQPPGSTSPIGRSTRCFKAYCLQDKKVVLLKDSWRVYSPTLKSEHEIYETLHEHKVQNVPEVYHGADIGNEDYSHHVTQTKIFNDKLAKPFEITLRTHRHYRIALEYLPLTLEEFENVHEMITIIQDASIAHGDAATKAKILHRDISNGNIMFKRKTDGTIQGYLIDWDLSLDLELADKKSGEAQPERTGTWQFLAIRLFPDDGVPVIQNRIDDVESFYHLIFWMALRYTSHELNSVTLTETIHENFDSKYFDPETGQLRIRTARFSNMGSSGLIAKARFANAGIVSVLESMWQVLCERYTQPQSNSKAYFIGDNNNSLRKSRLRMAEEDKKLALETLENPKWLPTLLDQLLHEGEIDWKANEGRVKHELVKVSKFVPRKRKTESRLNSEGSRKASRKSGQSTPQDNQSGPN